MKRYMAFDEGCYECGEPSGIIGFYDAKDDAEAACERAKERQEAHWSGQHSFDVYDLEDPGSYSKYGDEAQVIDVDEATELELPPAPA